MATSEPLTGVDEIIRCGVCIESFTDPRQLSCGHVFCFECINRHFTTTQRNCAPCPICRVKYWPRERDANNLPKAIYIIELMNLRNHVAQVCEATDCSEDSALYLCLTCRQWLCDTCQSQTCNDGNTAHNAFIKTEIDPGLFDIVNRSRHQRCCKHHTQDVEWYCPQCRMLVCKLCKTNSHLHHKLLDVTEHSRTTRERLKQTAASLQKKQEEHRTNQGLYNNVIRVDLINPTHCYKMSDRCDSAIASCDRLVHLITHLLTFGSDAVVVSTFLNLEERVEEELTKCYSLDANLKELQGYVGPGCDLSGPCATSTVAARDDTQISHNSSDSAIFILNVNRPQKCESPTCESQTKTTSFICMRCRKWICGSCKKRRCWDLWSTDPHEAVRPGDIDRTLYDVIIRSRQDACNIHPEHVIDQYCCTCKMLMCTVCQTGHLHHTANAVTTQSRRCCAKMEKYQERLQKQIKDYSIARDTFLKMQKGSCSEALNPSYCATVVSKCASGEHQCNLLHRDITSLLLYGSHRVIIEMFVKMEAHIDIELKKTPLEFMISLERLASFITETLDTEGHSVHK